MILLDTNRIAPTPKRRLEVVAAVVEFDCLGLNSSSTRSGCSRSSSSKDVSWLRRNTGSKEKMMIVNISGSAGDWRCLAWQSWHITRVVRSAGLHSGLHQFDGPWTELHKLYLKADKPEGRSCWIISAHQTVRSAQEGDSMALLLLSSWREISVYLSPGFQHNAHRQLFIISEREHFVDKLFFIDKNRTYPSF